MLFHLHLAKNTVSDVAVTTPVGGSFSVSKLIHVVAFQLFRETMRFCVNLIGAIYKMRLAPIELDLFDFFTRGALWHHGNKG
ncbi:Uncharacterised protein [Vibrio cholerae]|uniref:Uncharacterized protein n=1 Tax=Vibrio cholerae TaxID=666 RepID=A0A655UGV8_VIBCL|nr:Uncharacterised protein [Vibrio cholerae]CRZ58086.1 Uncharacterised protein [Vibrio cholerae]CSA23807.1 Uncharacterised protein [Vibrio cholerae]CSA55166.1 Uncharacterised protein [Vibrio cholerae]CSA78464.1 Uncharacterised protein [Vibrio cholerae]